MLVYELDSYAPVGEAMNKRTKVIEVASKPVHAVHDKRVTSSYELQHGLKFRTFGITS